MSKKIVIVKQQDLKDCGVSCLAAIIEYYGGYVPIERLRLDTNTTKDGTTAFNILKAAKKYNFAVKGILVDTIDISNVQLPAIAHLDFKNGYKHFVVIYNVMPNKVILMDPARGKVVMKRKEFEQIFSKVLLMFYPQRKITVFKKEPGIEKIIIKILKNDKRLLLRIIIISLIFGILSVLSSYYFKIVIDNIDDRFNTTIICVFFFIVVFKSIFVYLRQYLENYLAKEIDTLLYKEFFNHLLYLPLLSISSRNSGDILTRVKELNNLKSIFIELFSDLLLNCVFMIIVIPLLIIIEYHLFLILLITLCLYFLIIMFSKNRIYQKSYNNLSMQEVKNSYILEAIHSYESIKNLNVTDNIYKKVIDKSNNYINDTFLFNRYINRIWLEKYFISEITIFIVYTLGFYYILNNRMSVTDLVTFSSLMIFFLEPIKNMLDMIPRINYIKSTMTKVNEFMCISKERLGENVDISNKTILVDNLSFSYDNLNTIIDNKSFIIKDGSKVLLKGESGCGKSSFCKILLKYYSDYKGIIKIGNANLKDLSLLTIRNNIIYVSQNESLFNDTIKNNILVERDISLDKINEVIEICLLKPILEKKNFELEAFISNDDNCFSGGEKQRIILARALLSNAKIIILDEALSEVDYNNERKIIKNIINNYPNKTLIYVTHKNHDDLFDNIIIF